MPLYTILNLTQFEVALPFQGSTLKAHADTTVRLAAHTIDTDAVQAMIEKGLIRVEVEDDPSRDDVIEIFPGRMMIKRVLIQKPSDWPAVLDSSVEYFLDGVIDMTGTGRSLEIPSTSPKGAKIRGYDFDTSKLICGDDNYTLFTSPIEGSGNVLMDDFAIEITGTNSQVWDVKDSDGTHAIEFSRVNYNNCTSIGKMDGYRQGLETGTGRFGGTPTLELAGAWAGGYRITTSIVRGIDNAMAAPLFKAGAGFTMASRFLTDINADLGATASLLDFASANLTAPSLLQIQGAIITRNGVTNADDPTLVPNIGPSDLKSSWRNNQGLRNTFVGGLIAVTAEIATNTTVLNEFVDLDGTWTPSNLQHFDGTTNNGQLEHLGNNPSEFSVFGTLQILGTNGDVVELKLLKWDASETSLVDIGTVIAPIINLPGSGDIALVTFNFSVVLDKNDYVKVQIANTTTAVSSVTARNNSFIDVAAR